MIAALDRSALAQKELRARNFGGAFTAGYVIVFTDGDDTAGLATTSEAIATIAASPDEVLAVGLEGEDYDPATLRALSPHGVIDAPSVETLARDFSALAARIAYAAARAMTAGPVPQIPSSATAPA